MRRRTAWFVAAAVAAFVLAAQLALVAAAGTDIPFHDQWDAEGRALYAAWRDGTWRWTDLFRPHNEHRIAWTQALNLLLFVANGQWDPLLQMAVGAGLRAAAAGGLAGWIVRASQAGGRAGAGIAAGVALAFLPHLAWHNALWGFQSQVYFSLLFSLGALALLAPPDPPRWRQGSGLAVGGAGLLAMSAGALVPAAVLGLVILRALGRRRFEAARWREAWPALVLALAAWTLRAEVPAHAAMQAGSVPVFLSAWVRVLAWPHEGALAAVVLTLPWLWLVGARAAGLRPSPVAGEDAAVALGGWSVALAAAMALTRGGSDELAAGVPSRYVDFVVLLPVASVWCAAILLRGAAARRRPVARLLATAWGAFLFVGWLGLSAQTMRRVILPRIRDREAPVRLAVAFQRGGDAAVFAGQARLLVPHPHPESVRAVLDDPRLRGALPPSFQPERPPGPLSRGVRGLLGRGTGGRAGLPQ